MKGDIKSTKQRRTRKSRIEDAKLMEFLIHEISAFLLYMAIWNFISISGALLIQKLVFYTFLALRVVLKLIFNEALHHQMFASHLP